MYTAFVIGAYSIILAVMELMIYKCPTENRILACSETVDWIIRPEIYMIPAAIIFTVLYLGMLKQLRRMTILKYGLYASIPALFTSIGALIWTSRTDSMDIIGGMLHTLIIPIFFILGLTIGAIYNRTSQ